MNSNANDTVQISINACNSCRRLHKKCDRQLPSCTHCVKQYKDCCYNTVHKRGRKSNAEHNPPYPTFTYHKSISAPSSQPITNTQHEALQLLFVNPQIERLYRASGYAENLWHGKDYTGAAPDTDFLALLSSLQALMLRSTDMDLARSLFDRSKALAMSVFDCILQDSVLATCFIFLGAFCMFDDDLDRASFFLDNVKKYVFKSTSDIIPGVDFLRAILNSVEQVIDMDMNLELAAKGTILHQHTLQEFLSSIATKTSVIASSKMLSQLTKVDFSGSVDIEQIRLDFRSNTNHYVLDSDALAVISAKMTNHLEHLVGIMPAPLLQLAEINSVRVFQGVQLQNDLKVDNMEMALERAQLIARMTTTPIFEKFDVVIGAVTMLAANAHMHYVSRITDDQNMKSNVLECMKLELKSLTSIQQKHKHIGKRCESTIHKLAYHLQLVQESLLLSNMFSTSYQDSIPVYVRNLPLLDNQYVDESDRFYEIVDGGNKTETQDTDRVVDQFFQDFI
jgi:hypothetical protein